jgi:hypothetical protein
MSKVSLSTKVDWCELSEQECVDSDFEYVASTSEAASSGNEDDAEKLEALFGAVYSSSGSPVKILDPAERHSLLLFDKDFAPEEDLEACTPLLHSPIACTL